MGMSLEDFYFALQHPVDSAVGTAKEVYGHFGDPRKKYKTADEINMVAPAPAPAVPVSVAMPAQPAAYPFSTLPTGSGEEELYNYKVNTRNKVLKAKGLQ